MLKLGYLVETYPLNWGTARETTSAYSPATRWRRSRAWFWKNIG